MKNDPIIAALEKLEPGLATTEAGRKELKKALAAKSNLVAAKAAKLVGEALCSEMQPELVAAFNRFLPRGSETDKGCSALKAIARALVMLDADEPELYRRGIRHVQMEGTWGGAEDTAAELRAACAMGLANSREPDKLREIVELLADTKSRARGGAVRALAAAGSEGATLVLRYKALLGDDDPEVVADCLAGLLELDGAAALPLVRGLARSGDVDTAEAAIQALGDCRRDDAVALLIQLFEGTADRERKRAILLALASSRTEGAREFLAELMRDEPETVESYRRDARLRAALDAVVGERGDKLERQ